MAPGRAEANRRVCKVGIRAEVRAMIDAAPFIIVFGSVGVLGSRGSPIFDEIRAHSSVLQLVTFGCHGRHLDPSLSSLSLRKAFG